MWFDSPESRTIRAFLARIGIPVVVEALPGDTCLPAMTVRRGKLIADPDRVGHPGDLLHDAGHIAVMAPDVRDTLDSVPEGDGAQEMATIAWSYAAAMEIGITLEALFHEHGYHGGGKMGSGGGYLAVAFGEGRYVGAPLLDYWGMALSPGKAEARGVPPYPHMLRWLR
jgi:hypothetical protein